ncbi:MAG: signal transduction histidine kinase [Myxococcota bacterium]|jgi:signal transduction histidine kinase
MDENYLKRELYDRFRQDDALVAFLQSNSPDGLWFWDLENPEHEWMSPRFWETFGCDPATRKHRASERQGMIHSEDLAAALEVHPSDQVVRYRHRDGSTVWIRCRRMAICNEAGVPIRMLGAHTNITALKENEETVRQLSGALEKQSGELKRANAELEMFAYSVSHDLRAPLRAIAGYSQLLEEEYGEVLDEDGQELLSVILRNTQRMNGLIRSLLTLSGLNQVAMKLQPVDMTRAAIEASERASVDGAVRLDIALLPEATADPKLIAQVWQSLLDNAVKYSSEEADPCITIRSHRDGDAVIYSVADNGAGFNMAHVDRLFTPFQRLHSESRFTGHGIGLALIRRIITRHGGRVWAEGVVGEGATFSFALPAAGVSLG